MNRTRKYQVLMVAGLLLAMTGVGTACARQAPAAPPPDPVRFEIAQGAEIARVEWSIGSQDLLWVNVTVLNKSDKATGFLVSVKADDEPEIIAAAESAKKLEPGKTQVYKVMTPLATTQPRQLFIKVAAA